MPTASDGKKFPYTPQVIKAHEKYEANLNRKNKSMGKDKTESPYNKLRLEQTINT